MAIKREGVIGRSVEELMAFMTENLGQPAKTYEHDVTIG